MKCPFCGIVQPDGTTICDMCGGLLFDAFEREGSAGKPPTVSPLADPETPLAQPPRAPAIAPPATSPPSRTGSSARVSVPSPPSRIGSSTRVPVPPPPPPRTGSSARIPVSAAPGGAGAPAGGPLPAGMQTLGPYRVVRLVGQGGMSAVYEGYDAALDRSVALKVLAGHLSSNPIYVERFLGEARAVARIEHPNVVSIYFIGSERGFHYFAMELIRGGSLEELVEREGPLSPRRTVGYLAQAAEGLAAAAAHSIIHRDIKPSNLMLAPPDRIKITDFGLAKLRDAGKGLTQDGMTLGTPHYMSPEQSRAEAIDFRSDIYSLGATGFQLLTGRPPYDGETSFAVMLAVNQHPVPELPPEIPAAIREVVRRMMAKDPDDRQQNYVELVEELKRLQRSSDSFPALPIYSREEARELREHARARQARVEAAREQVGERRAERSLARVEALLGGPGDADAAEPEPRYRREGRSLVQGILQPTGAGADGEGPREPRRSESKLRFNRHEELLTWPELPGLTATQTVRGERVFRFVPAWRRTWGGATAAAAALTLGFILCRLLGPCGDLILLGALAGAGATLWLLRQWLAARGRYVLDQKGLRRESALGEEQIAWAEVAAVGLVRPIAQRLVGALYAPLDLRLLERDGSLRELPCHRFLGRPALERFDQFQRALALAARENRFRLEGPGGEDGRAAAGAVP